MTGTLDIRAVATRHTATPWLETPRPLPGPRLRLFCVPYAGGSASVYRDWPAALAPDIEVCAVQPPGRGGRLSEQPHTRMEDLLDDLEEALEPHLDRPYAVFGHSMGALVGYEMVRRFRDRGRPRPLTLIVSGRPAPHLTIRRATPVHALPEDAFRRALREMNGTPEEVLADDDLMAVLGPALRADFAVCERWRHTDGRPLDVPLLALGGDRDPGVPTTALSGWSAYTTRRFTERVLRGDHFYLHTATDSLLELVSRALCPAELLAGNRRRGTVPSTTDRPQRGN